MAPDFRSGAADICSLANDLRYVDMNRVSVATGRRPVTAGRGSVATDSPYIYSDLMLLATDRMYVATDLRAVANDIRSVASGRWLNTYHQVIGQCVCGVCNVL